MAGLLRFFFGWVVLLLLLLPAWAQTGPTPTPIPLDTMAIPLGNISSAAESASTDLATLQTELKDDTLLGSIRQGLPPLTQEIEVRRGQDARLLQARPDLETIRGLENNWRLLGQQLPGWKQRLEVQVTHLDDQMTQINRTMASWSLTLGEAGLAGLPADILFTAQSTLQSLKPIQEDLHKRRAETVVVQNAVAAQATRMSEALDVLEAARLQAVSNILLQDSPPLWSGQIRQGLDLALVYAGLNSTANALATYLQRQASKVLGPIFLFLVFYLLLSRAKPWATLRAANNPELHPALVIVQEALATSLLISLAIARSLDPSAPRLLQAGLGAVALVPAVVLLRRLAEPFLWPVLNALVVFCFVDLLRFLAATIPVLARLLLLTEGLLGLIFLFWFSRQGRLSRSSRLHLATYLVTLTCIATALANLFGYVSLATLLSNGLLGAAYAGAILYGALKVVEGLLALALELRPLSLLHTVRLYRAIVQRRTMQVFRLAAGLTWLVLTLDLLGVRETSLSWLVYLLNSPFGVGSIELSLSRILTFVLILWLSVQLSRLSRFALNEDVFPYLSLSRGVPYTLSMVVHYGLLLVGIVVALSALGVDTGKFALVIGILTVGLGFGLQNIVNNYVSGLILLVERPVNVGDTLKLGEQLGEIRRIGLRSSTLDMADGSQAIVPNSELINQKVVNWTRGGTKHRAEVTLGIALHCSTEKALELMAQIASANPQVVKLPAPQALLLDFNGRAIQLQLLAWVEDHKTLPAVRSQLARSLVIALRAAEIELIAPN